MFEKTTLIIDGSGECVKLALAVGGGLAFESKSDAQSIESVAAEVAKLPAELSEIGAYAVCTGPGSMLGTRFASAYVSTLAKLFGADIFEWDAMQTAAFALADAGMPEFSLLAPSRKGYANLLNFAGGAIESESETEIPLLPPLLKQKVYNLYQRKNAADEIAQFEKIDIEPKLIFGTLKKHPELLSKCDIPPDAKPLTRREYVKWKAQAHI